MSRQCAVNNKLKASSSSLSSIADTTDNKTWTELIERNWPKKLHSFERSRCLSTSSETNRKLFCGGEEHDEKPEKQDLSKDEKSNKQDPSKEENSIKKDLYKDKWPKIQDFSKDEHPEKQDLSKDEHQWDFGQYSLEDDRDLSNEFNQDSDCDHTFSKQVEEDLSNQYLTDDHKKTECGTFEIRQVGKDLVTCSQHSSDDHLGTSCVSEVEDCVIEPASDSDARNNPSSKGFHVITDRHQEKVIKTGVEMVFADNPHLFNLDTCDSSINMSKHLTSLIERRTGAGSVYYISEDDSCSLNTRQNVMMGTNRTGLTDKETSIMMDVSEWQCFEHIFKCNKLNDHSKDVYISLFKTVLRRQDTGCNYVKLDRLFDDNEKDKQSSQKCVEADVQEKAVLEDQEKVSMKCREMEDCDNEKDEQSSQKYDEGDVLEKSMVEEMEKVELDGKIILESNTPSRLNVSAYEEENMTGGSSEETVKASESKSSDHFHKTDELLAAWQVDMNNIENKLQTLHKLQREIASFSVLFRETHVNVNHAIFRVRSCAEKCPSGGKSYSSGQSGQNGGSQRSRQRQNSDESGFSGSGQDGTNDEDKNNAGDRNNNKSANPTRSMLNAASLPQDDYKAYKKKHSTASLDSLCYLLGSLAVNCQEGIIDDTLLTDLNRCLEMLLHNVLQQPSSNNCSNCDILHSLMCHFATTQHGYMSCSLCIQIFLIMQWHIVRCTDNGITEERSSIDICHLITKDTEFKTNLVQNPERMWYKLLKYLGAILCSSSIFATGESANDVVNAKPNSVDSAEAVPSMSVVRSFSSPLTSIPENEDAGIVKKHQPLVRRRSQPQSVRFNLPGSAATRQIKSIGGLPAPSAPAPPAPGSTSSASSTAVAEESKGTGLLDDFDNVLSESIDISPPCSLGSGSASGTGLSAEEFISKFYKEDPYTTQTKTYGGHGLISLPVGSQGLQGRQQMMSLEMRPVGEPGIGEVVYGTRHQLLKVARSWTPIKFRMEETGELHDQLREEGVILAESRNNLKILRTRYQKRHQWERLVHLGNGLSGKCHLAVDNTTGFRFCVKRMHLLRYEETELEMWSKLEHPHIVKLYGAIRKGRKIYLFSEFIDGGSLTALIDEQRSLNRRISHWMALKYLKQLLNTLQYLKEKNIVHEDLKCDNILLRRNSTVIVLTDFGLARWFNKDQELAGRAPTGSQPYWSPEKAASQGHGFASDRWAAICILVHMLSGHPPWTCRYGNKTWLHYIIFNQSPPMQDVPENIQKAVRNLICFGFTLKPTERPDIPALLAHQAFQILEQGAPDTCYSVLQSSGGQMPNNILQKGQSEDQDIEEILQTFQDCTGRTATLLQEPTNNLSLIKHSEERHKSVSILSLNIPNPVGEVSGPIPSPKKLSEQYQSRSNDAVTGKQTSVSTTDMLLPITDKGASSNNSDIASNEDSSKQSEDSSKQNEDSSKQNEDSSKQNDVSSKTQFLAKQENSANKTEQTGWNDDDELKTSDSDFQLSSTSSDDQDSICQFFYDDASNSILLVRASLEPYKPNQSQITTKLNHNNFPLEDSTNNPEKISSARQNSTFAYPHGNGSSDPVNTGALERISPGDGVDSRVPAPVGCVEQRCKPLIPANTGDGFRNRVASEPRCDRSIPASSEQCLSKIASEISDMYGEPCLSADLYGSDPEKQLKDMNLICLIPEETNNETSNSNLCSATPTSSSVTASVGSTTSIDDLLDAHDKVVEKQRTAARDVTTMSHHHKEQQLYLNVNMTPKNPLHKTLSETVPGTQENHHLYTRSKTSPGTLTSLASRQQSLSQGMPTFQKSPSSIASGQNTPGSSEWQTFSEANPSTPRSQYDHQQKEFDAVFQTLSESGISVEDPDHELTGGLNIELGLTDDDLWSIQLTSMQQELQDNCDEVGVLLQILSESDDVLKTIIVPHACEDWRSVADMIRRAVHSAGMNHFTLKSSDGSDIDFNGRIDKSKMSVIAAGTTDDGCQDGCWCEDHQDHFRGIV